MTQLIRNLTRNQLFDYVLWLNKTGNKSNEETLKYFLAQEKQKELPPR